MSVINAWLLYRRQISVLSGGRPVPLHEFKTRVAVALCASKEANRGGPSGSSAGKRKRRDEEMTGNPTKKRPAVRTFAGTPT